MTVLYTFTPPPIWWSHVSRLDRALQAADTEVARNAYAGLLSELAAASHADLAAAAAHLLLYRSTPYSRSAMAGTVPEGLSRAFDCDVQALRGVVCRDWSRAAGDVTGLKHPPLVELAPEPQGAERALADALERESAAVVREQLDRQVRQNGDGPLAQHLAFRWTGDRLQGIPHPSLPRMERLVGLSRQLDPLAANTTAFLERKPALHVLLYGPRGSGKSTAVRSLLPRHHAQGLRLVEISPEDLQRLPDVLDLLRGRPHRYILFVDDLGFEAGDTGYAPLKTLLEGSLTEPPANALVYATSNRRHLVRESFGDRPDPWDEDVHAADTQHTRLALADRFGLTITFPDANQRRYLEIVHGLVGAAGAEIADLDDRAIRFAEWGNGYSGRTAEQFIRTLGLEARA